MTTRRNHLTESRIHSPNPLQFIITVNEFNGAIQSHSNRPTPHLQAIVIMAQVIMAQVQDSLRISGRALHEDRGLNGIHTLAELIDGLVQAQVAAAAGGGVVDANGVTVPVPGLTPGDTPGDNPADNPAKPEEVN